MQKLYFLFYIQVQCYDGCYDGRLDGRCGWSDKFNGSFTDCDDSELEKYFQDAQYRDPDVSWKELFKEL